MGLKSFFMRILHRPSMIDSINQSQINQSITNIEENSSFGQQQEKPQFTQIPMHKESLELGLAAGYAGKSLKEMEASLSRIETQLVTKDWFANTFEDKTPDLIETIKKHEENDQRRFELMQNMLNSLKITSNQAFDTPKIDTFSRKIIEVQLSLTPKMQELVTSVKERGEMSYKDLAQKLLISEDALRGLLSNTTRRTKTIQRFEKDNKGWVRFIY